MNQVPLGDLVTIIGGGTPDRDNPTYWDGDIPWITVKDFKSFEICGSQENITKAGLNGSASNLIPAGTIIIPTRMALGKVAISEVDVAINQDLKALQLRDKKVIDRNYLFHFFLSKTAYLESCGQGATVKGITLDVLRNLQVPLPKLSEQKRIAGILEKADSVRRKCSKAIDLAEKLLRAVFIEMYGDPTNNPKDWPVREMGDIIEFKGGSQPPKDTFIDELRPGYVRLVQIRDFKSDRYKVYIPIALAKSSFESDDVMIARYGPPVFQILRGLRGSYNVALMKAQPKTEILKEVVFWLLQLPAYHSTVVANSERTAGQSGVNLKLLNKLAVPLPPIEYQRLIADRTIRISALIKKQHQMFSECDKQFRALQAQFFDN